MLRDFDCPRVDQPGPAQADIDTQPRIAFDAVCRLDDPDGFAHAFHHRAETELGLHIAQAIACAMAHLVGKFCAADDRL